MKFRKFEFRIVEVKTDAYGEPVSGTPMKVDYRRIAIDILRAPGPDRNHDAEHIAKAVYICGKLITAFQEKKGFALLTQEDYTFFKDKVLRFNSWTSAQDFTHDFNEYIKELKEEEFDVTEKPA